MSTEKSKKRNFKQAMNERPMRRMNENTVEFGEASRVGLLIRNAFGPMVKATSPNKSIAGRMQKLLLGILKTDISSIRGQRLISKGDLSMLLHFDFNEKSPLSGTFYPYQFTTVDRAAGKFTVKIPPFIPDSSVSAPLSSSHFRLWMVGVELDLEKETFSVSQVRSTYQPLDMVEITLPDLEAQFTPGSKQALILALSVEFFQEVNGNMYQMKNDNLIPVKVLHAESAIV
ncbi:MAG: hypothetical protein J7578_22800 [Chitinophagaceae bacterium]|nr:hypothetical protein [Chitinophagaceae bacterium]